MAKNYTIKQYCQDEGIYKYEEQTDVTFDPNFVPVGCETHTLNDAVIEEEKTI